VERGDETAAQSRINCSLPYQLLLARKLVRDIRRAMRKHRNRCLHPTLRRNPLIVPFTPVM
jgi:hypothetical protein